MARLFFTFFGPFQANHLDRPNGRFRTKKVKALLIYLLTEQAFTSWPLEHQRPALMALLWPELPERLAQNNLRQTLFHLRKFTSTIPSARSGSDHPFLLTDRQTVTISSQAIFDLDVAIFESLINRTQNHEHISIVDCITCLEDFSAACDLYQGDFLADFSLPDCNPFEEWALLRREHFRRRVLNALHIVAQAHLKRGAFKHARRAARRQLEIDNLHDNAYRQLMEALARDGQRAGALITYRQYCDRLHFELNTRPSQRLMDMEQAIRADKIEG